MAQDRWRDDDDDDDRSGYERGYGQRRGGYRGGEERQGYGSGRDYGQSGRYGRNSDDNRNYQGGGYGSNQGRGYGGGGDYGYSQNRDRNYENYSRGYESPRGRSSGERGERGMWDRASDEVSSWFGDDDAERRRRMDQERGGHYGRGPKGYTRSDDRIGEDVNDRLTDDPRLDASEIEVEVSEGEVTLTGTVSSREDKRYAEDVAERVSGVKHVQNNLRVQRDNYQAQSLMSGSTGTTSTSGTSGTSSSTSSGSSSSRKERS